MTEPQENQRPQQQALEPIEQESIPFHGEQIIAVRLPDGRIGVVLRWVCSSLGLDPQAQVRRIERTTATASELVRVRVQTRGGKQIMPAVTLRGFSPWILGINSGEVRSDNPTEDEHIRALIVAYQEEAKDALYEHFVNKRRLALPAPENGITVVPAVSAKPQEPGADATDVELTAYYEDLAVWAHWKAAQHAQRWRTEVDQRLDGLQVQLESEKAVTDLIPEIIERLGPETVTPQHHRQIQILAKQLHQTSGKPYPTIYDDLKTAFDKGRIEDLLEEDWPKIAYWFQVQIERVR